MTAVRIAKIDAEVSHESSFSQRPWHPQNISILLLHRTTECAEWSAVLLLDEVDVFLEQHSLHNIHRNVLISVYL